MHNALPEFPVFEKLSLDHKEVLQAIVNSFPSSDFNFAGLFTWDVDEAVHISSLNENIVMRSSDYLTHDTFYSFIGDNKVNETIKTLTEYAKQRGEESKLRLITESVAKNIDANLHDIDEDRDNFDYIFHVSDLVALSGGRNQKRRQKLHRFKREHGPYIKEVELNLNDETVLKDIKQVMAKWQTSRRKHINEVRDEFVAIEKALNHHQTLGMRAFGIYHGQDLIAFQLFEILPGKIAIGHFEKADAEFEDVFLYLKHAFAEHLSKMDVEIYNTEQDLGVPGMRESKLSYGPASYIKKYTITKKSV